MHLNVGDFVLYTPIYRLTGRKKRFHEQNCPCGTVCANIGYVLGLIISYVLLFDVVASYFRLLLSLKSVHIFIAIYINIYAACMYLLYKEEIKTTTTTHIY